MSDIIYLVTTYDFIWRAFLAGLMITLCASLLGVSIVLKRLSMIGDGISHISFGSIAIATSLGMAPLKLAIPLSVIASIILFCLSGKRMKGDSGIAVISSGALAIGIIMISYHGSSADMNNYLVGSLYSVTKEDMLISSVLCIAVIACFIFLYNRIFSITFDEDFSKATGIKGDFYSVILAVLTAVTVVIGMRLMGALLISALAVFPALSAMSVFNSFLAVTICSVVVSIVSFLIGFTLTLILDAVPTGACITLSNLVIFLFLSAFSYARK